VGGTGLYIRAITTGLDFAQREGSAVVRTRWQDFADNHGAIALHQELVRRDPVTAARLHANDLRRVIRALEVEELTGKPLSAEYDWNRDQSLYATLQFGLTGARDWLYQRVDQRVDTMIKYGLLEEVTRLLAKGYNPQSNALQAIGYKELVSYLHQETTLEQAIATVKQATRRLVKRQLSWFRRDPSIVWMEVSQYSLEQVGSQILSEFNLL
jgi:tRNA dimethylallyltransferase